jgi:hypothetical protein
MHVYVGIVMMAKSVLQYHEFNILYWFLTSCQKAALSRTFGPWVRAHLICTFFFSYSEISQKNSEFCWISKMIMSCTIKISYKEMIPMDFREKNIMTTIVVRVYSTFTSVSLTQEAMKVISHRIFLQVQY